MVNELRTNLLDASAPNPSVETLLHAFLPARFVDHTHADARFPRLAIGNQAGREAHLTSLFGGGLVWIPYVMPGFALAKPCADAFELVAARETPSVMVLEKLAGSFTWGDSARESYERTIDAVTRAERYAAEPRRSVHVAASAYPQRRPRSTSCLAFVGSSRSWRVTRWSADPSCACDRRGPLLARLLARPGRPPSSWRRAA